MSTRLKPYLIFLVIAAWLGLSASGAADFESMSGTWELDVSASGDLDDEINALKQEFRDYQAEHGTINDGTKPDPFSSRARNNKYDSSRYGPVPKPSINARIMVDCKTIKLYASNRFVLSYDGEIKRRINPNPAGRVYSATGKGVSKDAIGETLAYLEDAAFVVETRTTSAEQIRERFELTSQGRLKLTTNMKNPEWKRSVEFVRYFSRQ